MARYFVDIGLWDPDNRCNSKADADVEIVRIRDAFRDVLDPDGNQTNWQVTDVAFWQGQSNYDGYAFAVYHMDGGAPSSRTGPAWLFYFPGHSTGNSQTRFTQSFSGTSSDYFRTNDDATSFFTAGAVAIHYNETGGSTTPYGFGFQADGTLAGGDLSAPTNNPWTNGIASVLPPNQLYGYIWDSDDGMSSTQTSGTRACYVFDDAKPFLAAYNTNGDAYEIRITVVMGEIVVPYRSVDTFTSGTFSVRYASGNSLDADTHYIYTDGGVRALVEDQFNADFSRLNVPFGDGRYPWDVVLLSSSTYYKGYIDSDVIRVMGASGRQAYTQFDGGQFIKFHDQLCFPYAPNQPSFPYPDPTGLP